MTQSTADAIVSQIQDHADTITAGMIGVALAGNADALAAMDADQIRALAAPLIAAAKRESQARRG